MEKRIEVARACLTARGLRVLGGSVSPGQSVPRGPRGELIIPGAFLAFYSDTAQASAGAVGIAANARRIGAKVQQHASLVILWIRPPAAGEQNTLTACALS